MYCVNYTSKEIKYLEKELGNITVVERSPLQDHP